MPDMHKVGTPLFKAAPGYGVEDLRRSLLGVVRGLRVQGWVQVRALLVGAGVLVGAVLGYSVGGGKQSAAGSELWGRSWLCTNLYYGQMLKQ